jgi:catalase
VRNIVGHLSGAQPAIQARQVALFYKADGEVGSRVAHRLGLDAAEVGRLTALSDEDRKAATAG